MNAIGNDTWFSEIENIIVEPLKFKAKLGIGEDAYALLRLKKYLFQAWDVSGAVGTAVVAAQSTAVASTFFAPSGFLSAIGLGATAVTPIGWVVAAGIVTGGAWMGITSYIKGTTEEMVTTIPNFINTPLDVLALGLFDLTAPLALKIAIIDGEIASEERRAINTHFVDEWGYDPDFINRGIAFIEAKLAKFSIKETAKTLAEFQKQNPDCNFKLMSQEVILLLRNIIEADGKIDEREEMAIEQVTNFFKEEAKLNLTKTAKEGMRFVSETTTSALNKMKSQEKK